MTIRYLYHSGFAIQAQTCTIVIDYYRDTCEGERCARKRRRGRRPSRPARQVLRAQLARSARHFNPVVMSWQAKRPDIIYLLSSDILDAGLCAPAGNVHFLAPGDTYADDCLCAGLWLHGFGHFVRATAGGARRCRTQAI